MSYEFYRVVHVFSIILLFTSLGTLAAVGGAESARLRRLAAVAHGVALTLILVAGFGLLARLGMFGAIPLWAWLKLGIWLLLAMAVLPLRRRPEWAAGLWLLLPVLGGTAAWLAIAKPF
jgi:hypothetical protein